MDHTNHAGPRNGPCPHHPPRNNDSAYTHDRTHLPPTHAHGAYPPRTPRTPSSDNSDLRAQREPPSRPESSTPRCDAERLSMRSTTPDLDDRPHLETPCPGRLMRWRLRLSEFEFAIQYRPGIIHQVPDALSRIILPQENDNRPVDDEVPTYGDHENVLVTTRRRKRAANVTKTASERTARTSDSGDVRKRNGT